MEKATVPFAVTGATGQIGGRVARLLSARDLPQRLVVRDGARAPQLPGTEIAVAESYNDKTGLRKAFSGVDTVVFVSARESADRVAEHASLVDAATKAGVKRIVYTSFLGAAPDSTFTFGRDHYATEQYIQRSGLEFIFLRNSLYLDFMPVVTSAEGIIAGPAGEGRFAPVARDDIADVALALLTQEGHDGETYDVTGSDSLSMQDVASELGRFSGRPVTYKDETVEEAYASRASYGAEQWEVDGWVSMYLAVSRGELDVVSDTVKRLAGHAPATLSEFLISHPESCGHFQLK